LHVDGTWERRAARGQQVVDLRSKDEHRTRVHLQAAKGQQLFPQRLLEDHFQLRAPFVSPQVHPGDVRRARAAAGCL
jgi:hypothetical protein